MKLVIDEKLKHRLIGLAVIISLGMIFIPAMIKKSSQKLDGNFSLNLSIPEKPLIPDVAEGDEEELFKTIKVSRVQLPSVSGKKQLPKLVQAEPLNVNADIMDSALKVAKQEAIAPESIQIATKPVIATAAKALSKSVSKKLVLVAKKPVVTRGVKVTQLKRPIVKPQVVKKVVATTQKAQIRKASYAVQLASFSQFNNAQSLINKLRASGFNATMIRLSGTHGPVYKILAGHSPTKNEALRVKGQLATKMQLNGFIVNTGVS